MLRKKTNGVAIGPRASATFAGQTGRAVDRRTLLKRSGLAAGGLTAAAVGSAGLMTRSAEAQTAAIDWQSEAENRFRR